MVQRCGCRPTKAWTKLSSHSAVTKFNPSDVQSNGPSSIDSSLISKELLDEIDKRASLLSQFNQEKFERTGGVSRETAIQMARLHQTRSTLGGGSMDRDRNATAEDDSVP